MRTDRTFTMLKPDSVEKGNIINNYLKLRGSYLIKFRALKNKEPLNFLNYILLLIVSS